MKSGLEQQIAALEEKLKSSTLSEAEKSAPETQLNALKVELEKVKNPTATEKAVYEKQVELSHKPAIALIPYRKLEGTLNTYKTETATTLKIKKLPKIVYSADMSSVTVSAENVTFTKN